METIKHQISKDLYNVLIRVSTPFSLIQPTEINGCYFIVLEILDNCINKEELEKWMMDFISDLEKIFALK